MIGNSSSNIQYEWIIDDEEQPIEVESAAIEKRLQKRQFKPGAILLDLVDDDEGQNEDDILPELAEVIDLTHERRHRRPRPESRPVRNEVVRRESLLKTYKFNGSTLEPGATVEIKVREQPPFLKASFLYIKQIISASDGIKLRGLLLTRLRNLRGRLPRLRNEVAMILLLDSNDKRPEEIQGAIEVPITDVIKLRNCHYTNADFPEHRTTLGIYTTVADLEKHGVLMCRWRCIFVYRNAMTRTAHIEQKKSTAPVEYVIEHLNAKQLSKKRFEVSDTGRFNIWRGGKVRGGEHDPSNANSLVSGPVVQLEDGQREHDRVLIEKKRGQRYTFGDMFCGAGGASCGARKAGFQIKISCDHHLGACRTYAKVFPEAELYHMDIFDFIDQQDPKTRVDVLNLSPPCQFWSPAHTCAGVNDDANIAVLSSCHELIKKFRPRIFTLEQTFGILLPRFEYYFNALVHGFTQNNYSIRWKIVDLVDWGSPATRKRLVMLGSCPGEALPCMPKPTHVPPETMRRGKKPYLTVKRILSRIPQDGAVKPRRHFGNDDDVENGMHNPYEMTRKRLPRWDADVTLRRCITTNGGYGNYHPNGRRDFTLREYATLQTFPLTYPFQIPDRKTQIGNAFPPMVVKVLYRHLRKWLERQDGVYAIENEPVDPDDLDAEFFVLEDEVKERKRSKGEDDVEYVGSQPLAISCESSEDEMDIDIVSDDDDDDGEFEVIGCADVNQQRRVWPTIDLTAGDEIL
ncbi:S-adenosyl-L-methionine-dependent methyltransferase [Xylaria nigripes]|nr:S-adenosyl-L-methionine-dependent methyltransferase [Xylaria nigripes]